MRCKPVLYLFAPSLALFCAGHAGAQGGGFVFDEPEPPAETVPAEPPAPVEEAAPEAPATDTLEDFTFGGASPVPTSPVPDAERQMWDAASVGDAEALRRYMDAYPDGAFADEARQRLGEMQAEADRRAELVAACDRLAGDPADPGLSAGAGGVALDSIDADAALWTCSRARAVAPDLPRLAYNLGRISETQGQGNAALRNYRTALRLSIEQTGAPHLQAAAGLVRLSEPRNPSERMLNTMLQLAIEDGGRSAAQKDRLVTLESELAEARSAAARDAETASDLRTQVEALTARDMDLSSELSARSDALEAALARIAALEADLASSKAELEDRDIDAEMMQARMAELEAKLAAAEAEADGTTVPE